VVDLQAHHRLRELRLEELRELVDRHVDSQQDASMRDDLAMRRQWRNRLDKQHDHMK
jgi:hypothetical protein